MGGPGSGGWNTRRCRASVSSGHPAGSAPPVLLPRPRCWAVRPPPPRDFITFPRGRLRAPALAVGRPVRSLSGGNKIAVIVYEPQSSTHLASDASHPLCTPEVRRWIEPLDVVLIATMTYCGWCGDPADRMRDAQSASMWMILGAPRFPGGGEPMSRSLGLDPTLRLRVKTLAAGVAILRETSAQYTVDRVCSVGWEMPRLNGVELHHQTYAAERAGTARPAQLVCSARARVTEAIASCRTRWRKAGGRPPQCLVGSGGTPLKYPGIPTISSTFGSSGTLRARPASRRVCHTTWCPLRAGMGQCRSDKAPRRSSAARLKVAITGHKALPLNPSAPLAPNDGLSQRPLGNAKLSGIGAWGDSPEKQSGGGILYAVFCFLSIGNTDTSRHCAMSCKVCV